MAARPKADWEAIERDYRTGHFSDAELAAKHGNVVSRQAITKRAKVKSWTKDLTPAVRQATKAKLIAAQVKERMDAEVAAAVAGKVAESSTATISAVEVAAEVSKDVILQHRRDIRDARGVAAELLAELREARLLEEHKELLATILAGEGATDADLARARQTVFRAVSLGARVSSVKALAEAFTKLQAAERKAFGIEDDDGRDEDEVREHRVTFVGDPEEGDA